MRHLAWVLMLAALSWGCNDGDSATSDDDPIVNADGGATLDGGLIDDDRGGDGAVDGEDASVDDGDAEVSEDAAFVDPCPAVDEQTISGLIYRDVDGDDLSTYLAMYDDEDAPVEGFEIALLSGDDEWTTESSATGCYSFSDLAEGAYLLAPQLGGQPCSRHNCPRRLPHAVRAGAVNIVTIGDSVPSYGVRPFFPARLATLFEGLAEVNNQNVAVPGSVSSDWIPRARYFRSHLDPLIEDADVVVISIGGNDIVNYVNDPDILADIPAGIEGAYDVIDQIVANVQATIAEVRSINPNVDIVYILYVNYGQSETMQPWPLATRLLGEGTLDDIFSAAREQIIVDPHVVFVDMFEAAADLPLDDYLEDALHFNDLGHTLYAEEIFKALGGVLVGPSPLTGAPVTPLGLDTDYGLAQ